MYGSKEEITLYFLTVLCAVLHLLMFAVWSQEALSARWISLVFSAMFFVSAYQMRHNMGGGRPAI